MASLAHILKGPVRRLNPHRGLVIDVPTWSAAHEYHRTQQRLHTLSMHTPGIVVGLEVASWTPPDNSVVIYPGLAVDTEGNTIIVSEPQRLLMQRQESGTVYLLLQYREVPQEMAHTPGGEGTQPVYTLEGYALEGRPQPAEGTYIELARIQLSGPDATITDPRNIQEPGPDEIDLRYRITSGPRPLGEIAVGVVPFEATPDGTPRHQPGAIGLVQAINATTQYRAEFKGAVSLNQEVRDCDVLVMAGQEEFAMSEGWEQVLRHFLERGGVLMGETCGTSRTENGAEVPFQRCFRELAERLGRRLAAVERRHPLFTAHHLFAEAPEGIDGPGLIFADNGIIYTDADYGCLWDGGRVELPAPRASIRSAVELGINLGVYSCQRTHLHSVKLASQ